MDALETEFAHPVYGLRRQPGRDRSLHEVDKRVKVSSRHDVACERELAKQQCNLSLRGEQRREAGGRSSTSTCRERPTADLTGAKLRVQKRDALRCMRHSARPSASRRHDQGPTSCALARSQGCAAERGCRRHPRPGSSRTPASPRGSRPRSAGHLQELFQCLKKTWRRCGRATVKDLEISSGTAADVSCSRSYMSLRAHVHYTTS